MSGVNIAQPDITLILDEQGIIQEATSSNAISGEGIDAWLGRPWIETVGDVGGDKIRRIIEDARTGGVSAFRHVLQRFPSGLELPMEYTTVRVNGRKGGLLALGKTLQAVAELQSRLVAAQQATEREYWKLRDVETRYRLLFDASSEAVLMIGAEDFRIVEANPAAVRALGLGPGWEFPADMMPQERDTFHAMLMRVREQGRAPGIVLHLGARREAWVVRASLMAAEPGLRYLLQVAPASGKQPAPGPDKVVPIDALIDRLPDGFVVASEDGTILRANRAFLDLVQAGAEGAVVGRRLGRWLSEPGADFAALRATVQRHRAVKLLSTTIHGELGAETQVEISAAGDADADPTHFSVLLRDVGRRLPEPSADGLAATLGAMTEQLGRAPLLKVVKDTVELVERHCIRAALERVDGNRTAAAELLGLSRQSLHTKLNRYASDTGVEDDAETV